MFANWQLTVISLAYLGLLFFIAYLGDKYRRHILKHHQPLIYALSLGVYCTSWSFLGTTGQASTNILSHLPIYLGPILLFVFAWPFIQRLIKVSLQQNITSIADLLASRYGKSRQLARLVTLVALIGTMPYIALQIKAIVYSFEQLQAHDALASWKLGLIVSLLLGGFTLIFGIRSLDVTERHPGVMLAIAFESLVKLVAFIAVAFFVCFIIYDSPWQLMQQAERQMNITSHFNGSNILSLMAMLVIVMAAFLSLPRQFQVMVVELKYQKDTLLSRQLFPLYLVIFALLAVPLGLAGHMLLNQQVPAESYVLMLPWHGGSNWLTLFAFIGAISAASSMVIISAIALTTMLSNEVVFPWFFRHVKPDNNQYHEFRTQLLTIRKILVFVVILLGYGVFYFTPADTISSLGEVAFGAIAQLTPALLAAFYWRGSSLKGVYAGIFVGFSLWFLGNFLPHLNMYPLPFSQAGLSASTTATLLSLAANVLTLYLVSVFSRQSVQERIQSTAFLESTEPSDAILPKSKLVNPQELQVLVARFIGEDKSKQQFDEFLGEFSHLDKQQLNQRLLSFTEQMLAKVMGASSARLVINSVIDGRDIALNELAIFMEDASLQRQQFSQSLLTSAIENASEGISIIDEQLNLVAWNKRYLDLFQYPKELIYFGSPIKNLIRYNVERGLCGPGDINEQVQKRLDYLQQGSPHSSERHHGNGQVIAIQGNPLPGGGFVMMFSDITAYRQAEQVLKDVNLDLETRVNERTQKLAEANQQLAKERAKAESAHTKKSQFLKAVSHDLMQPLEAARLFTEALDNPNKLDDNQRNQVSSIQSSLQLANELLASLGDIARLESGNVTANCVDMSINELLTDIQQEFVEIAKQQQVSLTVMPSSLWCYSDPHLLRRIIQNLVANAIRYASPGKVVIGAKRHKGQVQIRVIDQGPGIPLSKQQEVFEQFTQLSSNRSGPGLGLGLNICRSLAHLLSHPLALESKPGKGCCFSVQLPQAQPQVAIDTSSVLPELNLKGICVLCVDNDPRVLAGMTELVSSWGCTVLQANSSVEAIDIYKQYEDEIGIVLVDYQLEQGNNGIDVTKQIRTIAGGFVPAILITATTEVGIEQRAEKANMGFMRKLVNGAQLKVMVSRMLTHSLQDNYL